MAKWANKPLKGYWVLAGDRQVLGETITEGAHRLCKKEFGVQGEFKKILGAYPSIVRTEGAVIYHAYLIPVKVELEKEPKRSHLDLEEKHISKLKYFDLDNIDPSIIGPSNRQIIKDISEKRRFIFREQEIEHRNLF